MVRDLEKIAQEKGDTWPKILRNNYKTYADNGIAMRTKRHGIWQRRTWKDYYMETKYLAMGMLSMGFEPGDKVAIIGDNSFQWYCAELAAQANHGIAVGMYSDLSSEEIKYILANSQSRYAIVEDQEQVDKLFEVMPDLGRLKKIVCWNYRGLAHYEHTILMGYEEALECGKEYEKSHPHIFEDNVSGGKAEDICSIVYTSGTTGVHPLGTLHSFKTLMSNANAYLQKDPWREGDNIFLYLPPAWITEQIFGICCHLLSASTLNFAESPETQQQDMREIGPHILLANSRIWEGQAAKTQARIAGARGLKKYAREKFLPPGYKMADMQFSQIIAGKFFKLLHGFSNLILFRPLRDSLGLSNIRVCCSTGALLSPDVIRFYHALNIPLKSIYGSAETGILSCAVNSDIRLDTQGNVLQGIHVKITEEGELICQHPGMFLGYQTNETHGTDSVKGGWVYTGDTAKLTEDNHLIIIDRMNDIVELDTGDRLLPQSIESRLKFSPYIKDVWVLAGNKKQYITAFIVIYYDNVGKWADRRKITYTTFADLAQKKEVYELIKGEIVKFNTTLPPNLRIKKFVNLHREFEPDEGELTRNRKLRRSFLAERYNPLIKAIYEGTQEGTVASQIKYRDGSTGTVTAVIHIESIEEVS